MFIRIRRLSNIDGSRDILAATDNPATWSQEDLNDWEEMIEIPGSAETQRWPQGSASAARLAADLTIIVNDTVPPERKVVLRGQLDQVASIAGMRMFLKEALSL